ncbi:MAG: NEW3 domain-containing protein [Gemmataceae bacterium]
MLRTLTAAALVAVAGLVGCNTSEPGGKTSDKTPSKATFNISGPSAATAPTIKQGDRQTVKLTLNRGNDFKEDVSLSVDAPTGLSVDLDPKKVKASDAKEVTATITAAKDAAVGDHTVKVTAKPETGNSTSVDFKVKVEGKKD